MLPSSGSERYKRYGLNTALIRLLVHLKYNYPNILHKTKTALKSYFIAIMFKYIISVISFIERGGFRKSPARVARDFVQTSLRKGITAN